MGKTVPIQDVYCSNQDYRKICNIDTEVVTPPTAPLIHQMSRFWLIRRGPGRPEARDREYKLLPGTIVSILPWQISDVIQVDAPLSTTSWPTTSTTSTPSSSPCTMRTASL